MAKELYEKLEKIKNLIRENENPDGTCNFNYDSVWISLELAHEMITRTLEK